MLGIYSTATFQFLSSIILFNIYLAIFCLSPLSYVALFLAYACQYPVSPGCTLRSLAVSFPYISISLSTMGRGPTIDISPPDVKIETTFFSEKIFQHHTMQLPSKTAQKKNL